MSAASQLQNLSDRDLSFWSDLESDTTFSSTASDVKSALPDYSIVFDLCKRNLQLEPVLTSHLSDFTIAWRPVPIAQHDKSLWLPEIIPCATESAIENAAWQYCLRFQSFRGLPDDWSRRLVEVLRELVALSQEEDEEGYQFKPTIHALRTATGIYVEAIAELRTQMPTPAISPDGEGGIRIEWARSDTEIRLSCPFDQKRPAYIYQQTGNDYAIHYDVTGACLAKWLRWLIEL